MQRSLQNKAEKIRDQDLRTYLLIKNMQASMQQDDDENFSKLSSSEIDQRLDIIMKYSNI